VRENRLLAALSQAEAGELLRKSHLVALEVGETLYRPNERIAHVDFPLTGLVSLVAVMRDGGSIEVATVGKEGMVGLPVFLGGGSATHEAFVQVGGQAVRVPATVLRLALNDGGELGRVLGLYTQALFTEISHSLACNGLHPVVARCARRLLQTQDRVGSARFRLTQEFLALMIGVRRASVSVAAARLQAAGLITYRRGVITIIDRAGLEAVSCECYVTILDEYRRLLG
jgi:CRP-like cAMP-binding protein